ncbi:MAG TPA: peptide MFS transporter [Longimicrobiales bacterium]|nr:peptide MFS transporter [Longimicrobiales bacterium]
MARETKPLLTEPEVVGVALDAPPPALERVTSDRGFFGHPRGLSTLFFTEMWERFSYYGIRPLLVLFMTAALLDGGFGFDRTSASSIVGIYAAGVYLAALPGGWVADRLLGLRRAIWYGAILIALGHLSIALSLVFAHRAFFLGLILIVLGTGLLKPNISAIVGDLYPEGGSRRDAGFSIFYMGINVGALVAPLITGFLGEKIGWHWGFGAAGVGMLVGVITYKLRADRTLGPIGVEPSRDRDPVKQARDERRMKTGLLAGLAIVAGVVVLAMTGVMTIHPVAVAESMSYVMLTMALAYFAYLFFLGGLTTGEKKRVAVIVVLFLFATIFWAAFEQAPTSLNLFARDYTDRVVFGWEMPTLWLQSANSLFVIALAPVFAAVWTGLGRRHKDPSSPAKFGFGLFFAGLGFLIMVWAANTVIGGGGNGVRVSPWWLVASYFLQTLGELSLSPVGLSSMTKLAPRKFTGQMMGVWFMAAALGNLIAGLVGGHVNPENLQEMPQLFQQTAFSLFIAAAVIGLLVVPIRRMMASEDPARR